MNHDDKTLLVLAAKAAGMPQLVWGEKYMVGDTEVDCTDLAYVPSDSPGESPAYWNPLTDDGDALRLAVRLRMKISHHWRDEVSVFFALDSGWCSVSYAGDPHAATRRAIVRAAAALAQEKP